jgi:hypothetical protein
VRAGSATAQVAAMATALSTDEMTVPAAAVYRTLLAEAMGARIRDCGRAHRGPVRSSTCGHCGRSA